METSSPLLTAKDISFKTLVLPSYDFAKFCTSKFATALLLYFVIFLIPIAFSTKNIMSAVKIIKSTEIADTVGS